MFDRVWRALKRRPVRVAEAVTAALALAGWSIDPEQTTALIVAVAAILGGEAAQTRTTPTCDPSLPDGHEGES